MVLSKTIKNKNWFIILLIICLTFSISSADLLNYYNQFEQNITKNTTNQEKNKYNTDTKNLDWQKLLNIGVKCSGGIPPDILLAIILTESGGNPYAININGVGGFQPKTSQEALKTIYKYNNANVDIGLMQVNYKTWAKVFNIHPYHLLIPEINICIGSQILRQYLDQHNWTWRGIGRYNATSSWKQANYAVKVLYNLKKIKKWWATQQ